VTIERRFVVGLQDIRAVSLECVYCKVRLTVAPEKLRRPPVTCPHCSERWTDIDGEQGALHTALVTAIKEAKFLPSPEVLAARGQKPLGYTLLLEFEEPKG
jgi:hypothetical protein